MDKLDLKFYWSVFMRRLGPGYIEDAAPMVTGDRRHSGFTDLRVTGTGHVTKES